MSVLYFADPTDPTYVTIGVDLNEDTSVTSGFRFSTVNWGQIEADVEWLRSGEIAGAEQAFRHHDPVEAEITLEAFFGADDYEALLAAYRLLGRYMDSHGVLVWQPDGIAEPMYIDTYPSPIPPLFRGQEHEGAMILHQLLDGGYEFRLWRHPYPRREDVTLVTAEAVTNAVDDNVVTFTNPGSAPSEARLIVAIPAAGQWVVQARAGLHAGDPSEVLTNASYAVSGEATVNDYWARLHRQVITPSDAQAFAGTYRILLVAALADDVFHLKAAWGATVDTGDPQANVNDEVVLDATEVGSFPDVEIDLGTCTFDADATALVIEIHGRSEGDTDIGELVRVMLIPADPIHLIVSSPGYRRGRFGLEKWKAEEFNPGGTAEEQEDGSWLLQALNDDVEVKPISGRTLEVGVHKFQFRGHARNADRTKVTIGKLQALLDDVVTHSSKIKSRKGELVTRYTQDNQLNMGFRVAAGDESVWRIRARYTAATDEVRTILTNAIRHWFIPVLLSGRRFSVDALTRDIEVQSSGGAKIAPANATGLLYLPPGESALLFTIGEAASSGYSDVTENGVPLPVVDSDTAADITLVVTPRELHP